MSCVARERLLSCVLHSAQLPSAGWCGGEDDERGCAHVCACDSSGAAAACSTGIVWARVAHSSGGGGGAGWWGEKLRGCLDGGIRRGEGGKLGWVGGWVGGLACNGNGDRVWLQGICQSACGFLYVCVPCTIEPCFLQDCQLFPSLSVCAAMGAVLCRAAPTHAVLCACGCYCFPSWQEQCSNTPFFVPRSEGLLSVCDCHKSHWTGVNGGAMSVLPSHTAFSSVKVGGGQGWLGFKRSLFCGCWLHGMNGKHQPQCYTLAINTPSP